MSALAAGRDRLACVLFGLLVSAGPVLAQDEEGARQRLEFMQAAVGSLEPEASDPKVKAALAVAPGPLLRYSDPTRGINVTALTVLLDAGVWRLGTEGRPAALVTVELYQAPDGSCVAAFEFLSLTDAPFSLRHRTEKKIRWDPSGPALTLKGLPDAPRPATAATARLGQMRQLARRFAATERIKNETVECRLLTQPIDRYRSAADKIVDGAIFAYANGTNPEIGVVLETDGERWQYGVLRLSSAETTVTLDGREVAAFVPFNARGRTDGPYHSASYRVMMDK